MNFKNDMYKDLIEEVLEDIFYKNVNYRTKIALLRHYVEVVVRKLLDYPAKKPMTLGSQEVKKQLKLIERENEITDGIISKSIVKVGKILNKFSHTEALAKASQSDFEHALDKVYDVISSLFILYFIKNRFGVNSDDIQSFSILPPTIRFKVLSYLYKNDAENIILTHKFLLAILKEKGKEDAKNWVENQKDILIRLSTSSNDMDFSNFLIMGIKENGKAHTNMFDHLTFAIEHVSKLRKNKAVPVYSTFEDSLMSYNKICKDPTCLASFDRSKELKDMIELLFIGRKNQLT